MTHISEKKQLLIDEFVNTPLTIGEEVYIESISKYDPYKIEKIEGNIITVTHRHTTKVVNFSDVTTRLSTYYIGADPFQRKYKCITPVAYILKSLIHMFNLDDRKRDISNIGGVDTMPVNWNPYVHLNDGTKKYYQRDFCWSLEDKQALIDSIYNGIGCGMVLVRLHSWAELEKLVKSGEKEISFIDIVDGKQRMDAIRGFINNEYTDSYGNYFADLSSNAQNDFSRHQLFSFAEMTESTTDDEVLFQFLKVNHAGKPQSKEHIDYVMSLLKEI